MWAEAILGLGKMGHEDIEIMEDKWRQGGGNCEDQ